MRKPYKITEIARQIEYLMHMDCSVHIIVDKATVDIPRLIDLSQDKIGFFRRLFGRVKLRYFRSMTEYNNVVLITFHKIDIPPYTFVFDYLLFAVGRRAAILDFTASKREILSCSYGVGSSRFNEYHVLPIEPDQNPNEVTSEHLEMPQGSWHPRQTVEYESEEIRNLPDGWRAKIFHKRIECPALQTDFQLL